MLISASRSYPRRLTNPSPSPSFINAQHPYISPISFSTVRFLFAHYCGYGGGSLRRRENLSSVSSYLRGIVGIPEKWDVAWYQLSTSLPNRDGGHTIHLGNTGMCILSISHALQDAKEKATHLCIYLVSMAIHEVRKGDIRFTKLLVD